MLAPIAFCLTMTSMFLSPVIAGERSDAVIECDDRIGSKTNVYAMSDRVRRVSSAARHF
jgi:hypothetical protein